MLLRLRQRLWEEWEMDSSQTIPGTPMEPVGQPATGTTPPVATTTSATPPKPGGSKMWMIMIAVAVVLILAVGGFLFMRSQGGSKEQPVVSGIQTDDLKSEVNSIDEGDVDSDFKEVDTSIQSL